MTIVRNKTLHINPTPEELADEFTNMDAEKQVRFLNAVAAASKAYDFQWCFQFQYITDSTDLTYEARAWMQQLGEYSGLSTTS